MPLEEKSLVIISHRNLFLTEVYRHASLCERSRFSSTGLRLESKEQAALKTIFVLHFITKETTNLAFRVFSFIFTKWL